MNLYYVIGTEIVKNKEVTDERAVPALDLQDLERVCNESYIKWEFVRGPYKMSKHW